MEALYDACRDGHAITVKEILEANPFLSINAADRLENTAMRYACRFGHDSIVSLLLSHPGINVNLKNREGVTPFMLVCSIGSRSCARVLLFDSRVKVNERDSHGVTPLREAARGGCITIIKWWIASGREMDLGEPGIENSDAIGQAHRYRFTEVATLLERFRDDPEGTRYAVRMGLRWYDEPAAKVFAIVVFLSDGIVRIRPGETARTPAARFLAIASQLPLELQMVLCYRLMGLDKDVMAGRDSEPAFRELAKMQWLPSSLPTLGTATGRGALAWIARKAAGLF